MLYVDTSALLKRYVEERDSARAESYLLADPVWVTAAHARVEVRRNLARLLGGSSLAEARRAFEADWERIYVVALDEAACNAATDLAEATGARTLDALHLAAAIRVGTTGLTLFTFDARQARAARAAGLAVVGV